MRLPPPPHNAFTLIEMVLVSAILLTLSTVALRSMFTFNEQRKLRTAAVELSGYLQVARSVANAANAPCTIDLTAANGGVFEPDSSATNACAPSKVNLPPAVRLGALSGSRDLKATLLTGGTFPLTFTPEGTVQQGATVLLSSDNVPNGAWCVNVQAPLATVRLGWQQDGGTCNYAIEQ